jgi:hypothetical protein
MYHEIEAFWDRSLRLWTCLWLDEEGNQLGIAQYANRRDEKDDLVDLMKMTDPCDYQI